MFQLAAPRCCTDVRRIGAPPSTTVAADRNWIFEMGSIPALLREGRRGLLRDSRRLPANSLPHTPKGCSWKGPGAFRPKAPMANAYSEGLDVLAAKWRGPLFFHMSWSNIRVVVGRWHDLYGFRRRRRFFHHTIDQKKAIRITATK
jgi:hypothetical protein